MYLSAGDLVRAIDSPGFRPDGAIVPTNAELQIHAPNPTTQRVLVDRVRKLPDVARDLQFRPMLPEEEPSASGYPGVITIGVDTFLAELPRNAKQSAGAFPRVVCLIATDFANGGAINRRELFTQDRVRKGIAAGLTALDGAGVQSVVMPLMGAASSGTQAKDAVPRPASAEGMPSPELGRWNRVGVTRLRCESPQHPGNRPGEWEQEITDMFSVPAGSPAAESAQRAYRTFADQIKVALNKGLSGQHTTASDMDNNCNTTFNAR